MINNQMDNSTLFSNLFTPASLVPLKPALPFYATTEESVFPWISDKHLSLAAPVVVYWALSGVFHVMDVYGGTLFDRYRIHEPEEVRKRNKVTPGEVIKAVILQHSVQTALGLLVLEEDSHTSIQDHRNNMIRHADWISYVTIQALGHRRGLSFLATYGQDAVSFSYWWLVPFAQFMWATFIMDTWQYFLHRLFHQVKFLYRTVHSRHHRLYCPYAFGALYNHPLEGFLFDSVSGAISQFGSCMTLRQASLFFAISTAKTVDDHCGFALPWDPCQFLWPNNALYHDTHHQTFGLKYNFSQPYFIHWDVVLGTRMKRGERPRKAYTDKRDPLVQEGKAVPVMDNLDKEL